MALLKASFVQGASPLILFSDFVSLVCFFFLAFLGLLLWHMEVPRLGVELELQLAAYTTATETPDLSPVRDLQLMATPDP